MKKNAYLIVILLLVALLGGMGCDEKSEKAGACDTDPCGGITGAVKGSCNDFTGGYYTCNCADDYYWDGGQSVCVSPCSPNPCASVANSTRECTVTDYFYKCGCDSGYIWWQGSCIDDPCDPNLCEGAPDATDSCIALGLDTYRCECSDPINYFWDNKAEACKNPCEEEVSPCGNDPLARCHSVSASTWDCLCSGKYFWDGINDKCTNPCENVDCTLVEHAIDNCIGLSAEAYRCECEQDNIDYFWNDTNRECINPCDAIPCDMSHATACTPVDADTRICGCESGYSWNAQTERCDDLCASDPCAGRPNARKGSCQLIGADDFSCECGDGYVWMDDGKTCQKNPCLPADEDPCQAIENTELDSCEMIAAEEFSCRCIEGYSWVEVSRTCTSCDHFESCLKPCFPDELGYSGCISRCTALYQEGCDCSFDFGDSPHKNPVFKAAYYASCFNDNGWVVSKAWPCAVEIFFDTCPE